jgi:phage terminase Nu1 subunit (DNA packaging protein)
MGKTVNKRDLAEILGVSERSLTFWQKSGLPILREGERGEENAYDTAAVVKWMLERAAARARRAATPRDRLASRQAELIELQLAEKRGESITASAIKPAYIAKVVASRQALRAMAADLAPALALLDGPDAMRDLLEEAIDDALRNLAADDDTSGAAPAPAGGMGALGAAVAAAPVGVGGAKARTARGVGRARAVPVPDDAVPARDP